MLIIICLMQLFCHTPCHNTALKIKWRFHANLSIFAPLSSTSVPTTLTIHVPLEA